MPARSANARWNGTLEDGDGVMELGSGAYSGAYSFASRFESGSGTNPEELIGAAHAGCFSMALSAGLSAEGYEPNRVSTEAVVHLEKVGEGFEITRIELSTEADVPGLGEDEFQAHARGAKENCPVSKALAGVEIVFDAKLVG